MIEVRAGVFVGSVSAIVRELLWGRICDNSKTGSVLLLHPAQNEQGFVIRTRRDRRRYPEDIEGLTLMRFT
jgi:CRISPR-associated protein Cas2